MTNVDFSEITIKAEPLSPNSTQEVLATIGQSPSRFGQSPTQQQTTYSPSPNVYPDHKALSTHLSPMMSFGVVKSISGHENITPNPSTTSTRSALKSSILSKRKARGETTPLTSTDDGPREYKLTKREIERKEARKEQNRRAARRCRMKKKRIQQEASQEMQHAVKENVNMKREVEDLRQQVNDLKQIISEHEQTQNCKLSHSANPISHTHPKTQQKKTRCQPSLHPCHVNTKSSAQSSCDSKSADALLQELVTLFPNFCPDASMYSNEFSMESTNSSSTASSTTNSININNCSINNNSNNNTFQTPSVNMDLNNFSDDLPSEEVPQNIQEILQVLTENGNIDFETPKVADEQIYSDPNNKMRFPFFQAEHSANNSFPKRTANSNTKSSVARNLNKLFTQNEVHPNNQGKQSHLANKCNLPQSLRLDVPVRAPFPNDTIAQASRFLLDPNLSSPILSCVPPNLVQQPLIPVSSTNNIRNDSTPPCMTSPNAQHTIFDNNNNNTPFEDQSSIHHSLDNQLHSVPMDHDLDDLPFADIEALSHSTSSTAPFLSYPACPIIPTGETLSDCCISTTTITTTSDNSSNMQASPGFSYQLSPISNPSPSSTATVSSPGFLHQASPHNLCPFNNNNNNNNNNSNNNNTNSDFFNNMVPVFDYNF